MLEFMAMAVLSWTGFVLTGLAKVFHWMWTKIYIKWGGSKFVYAVRSLELWATHVIDILHIWMLRLNA